MKFYWDTSAAINAAVSPVVNARLAQGEHFARLPSLIQELDYFTGGLLVIARRQRN